MSPLRPPPRPPSVRPSVSVSWFAFVCQTNFRARSNGVMFTSARSDSLGIGIAVNNNDRAGRGRSDGPMVNDYNELKLQQSRLILPVLPLPVVEQRCRSLRSSVRPVGFPSRRYCYCGQCGGRDMGKMLELKSEVVAV